MDSSLFIKRKLLDYLSNESSESSSFYSNEEDDYSINTYSSSSSKQSDWDKLEEINSNRFLINLYIYIIKKFFIYILLLLYFKYNLLRKI